MSRTKGSKNVKEIEPVVEKVEDPIIEPVVDDMEPVKETETIEKEAPGVPDVKTEVRREFWEVVSWKGVKNVYKCRNCGHCEMTKDGIILHVVTHFPKSEQDKQFEKLMKEY